MARDINVSTNTNRLAQAALGHSKQDRRFGLPELICEILDVDSIHGPLPWVVHGVNITFGICESKYQRRLMDITDGNKICG